MRTVLFGFFLLCHLTVVLAYSIDSEASKYTFCNIYERFVRMAHELRILYRTITYARLTAKF